MAEQWEYKFVNGTNLTDELNQLGEQGWEAVGIIPTSHAIENTMLEYQGGIRTGGFTVSSWAAANYSVLLKRRKP